MNWTAGDYLAAGLLIGGTAVAIAIAFRLLRRRRSRILAAAFLLILLAVVWAELAVGLFD